MIPLPRALTTDLKRFLNSSVLINVSPNIKYRKKKKCHVSLLKILNSKKIEICKKKIKILEGKKKQEIYTIKI